jgi:hypothetical protein
MLVASSVHLPRLSAARPLVFVEAFQVVLALIEAQRQVVCIEAAWY